MKFEIVTDAGLESNRNNKIGKCLGLLPNEEILREDVIFMVNVNAFNLVCFQMKTWLLMFFNHQQHTQISTL